MNITHVISDSNVGGAGVLLSSVAASLQNGIKCEIILPEGSQLRERLCGVNAKITALPISSDKSFSPKDVGTLIKYFSTDKPSVIHTHASLSARIAGRYVGIRHLLSTRHCAKQPTNGRRSIMASALYNRYTTLTVSTADCATRDLIREGVPKNKIVTIKNGVAPRDKTDAESRSLLRSRLGIPPSAIILGCAARLEWVKGQDLLIRAAARLIKNYPVHILLVGDGSMRKDYTLLAARLGILSHITFTGYVPDPCAYQNIFNINISSSRGTETSCLANSECMSLGIPSVVSDFGGNTEQITNMQNGLIFPADDSLALEVAIARLITDQRLYGKLCEGALMRYERDFSLARMQNEYNKLYLSLKTD